jgi:hypothetical protein
MQHCTVSVEDVRVFLELQLLEYTTVSREVPTPRDVCMPRMTYSHTLSGLCPS